MVRSFLLTIAMLIGFAGVALAQNTVLTGKVTDEKGEALIGASIKILNGTDVVRGQVTDYNGEFRVQIDPGTYDVEFTYTGYQTSRVSGVQVLTGQINFLNTTMTEGTVLAEAVITAYKVPLIEQDKTSGGQTLTSEQIKNLPTRSVNAIVATTAGTTSIDGGAINIKGSRSNATNYYIDGIRVAGSPPPVQDIEQIQVITGGLGAEYGDVTGGVISVVTKGPASQFNGAFEVENSYGLDPYGWLLGTANVSGPLLRKRNADGTRGETLIGFRLSGQYLSQKDDDPPAFAVHHAKDEVLANLSAHPLRRVNGNVVSAGEYITKDSVDTFKYNPYEDNQRIDLTGKLDFRLSSNIDISITGTYADTKDQFTPTGSGGWSNDNWLLLNSQNNPTAYGSRYRGIFRFRHRLGSSDSGRDASSANRVTISNASYQLQFGFERGAGHSSDARHGENLFDYGYVGTFNYNYIPVIGFENNEFVHIDYREQFTGYTAGTTNPGLAAYNEFANPEIVSSFIAQNGRFSGVYNNIWSNMHSNINMVYNSVNRNESDILTITANSGFDLKLGRSGTHSIQFGLLSEQRTQRNWTVAPYGLWDLMTQNANSHFNGLDTTRVIGQIEIPGLGAFIDQYAPATKDNNDYLFYKSIREKLGLELWDYVNPNGLAPSELDLSMFSARELTDQRLVSYYGYDYQGNKLASGATFNDFFTQRDATTGVRTFPVAPLNPLYQAAFIKDKFTFNKMIFSLGLRVERFDLNTKVMKDPYSLYEIETAGQYHSAPNATPKPGNIGDDYKVYVNGINDSSVKAYRNGNTWYFADGTQANDGNLIFGGGVVTPLLRDTITGDDIQNPNFNPNTAFEDYEPQVSWLPRLAFSFPISEDANFFAHYDILVQRPPSNWEVTPLNYFYFYVPGRTPGNNANLKPERVVDYEVGFQQRLNQNSALKFSAYYRELRDMIQSRTILYVPVIGRYETYGNEDFGTVKGFTVQYDLRRIQNTELRLAYTLQFADGTGSDANSQRGLTTRGNIRTLFPLSYDERHNIAAIIDYRFDSGKKYNGPRIGGSDILADFGINLQVNAASGRPYTANIRPARFGSQGAAGAINGSRLPWRFNVDMRIDKSFNLSAAGKRDLSLNVYLRVSNLLDRRNVVGVYRYTGSPTDDGYLASAEGQTIVQSIADQGRNLAAYLDSYSWALLNPGNFTQPRRIYIGAAFQF
ncbi:MAG: carboxypeptidase regulatory-like domain-containing protein [Saprospiraceae bacterium]|nr:carboxypeptidase regulatory-like domain-containing protein [Saprospiraceae bacterium]